MDVLASEQSRISERLLRLRETHNLSQEAAAARAGVTLRQWQRWEYAESQPYARNIAKISEEFAIPLNELVGNDAEPEPSQLDRIERELMRQGRLIDELAGVLEARLAAAAQAQAEQAAAQ